MVSPWCRKILIMSSIDARPKLTCIFLTAFVPVSLWATVEFPFEHPPDLRGRYFHTSARSAARFQAQPVDRSKALQPRTPNMCAFSPKRPGQKISPQDCSLFGSEHCSSDGSSSASSFLSFSASPIVSSRSSWLLTWRPRRCQPRLPLQSWATSLDQLQKVVLLLLLLRPAG